RPGAPRRTGPACAWCARGAGSGGCSPSPVLTGRCRWPNGWRRRFPARRERRQRPGEGGVQGGFVSEQDQAAGTAFPRPAPGPAGLATRPGGVRWTVRAGRDGAGRLATVLTRTCRGVTAVSRVPGSPPRDGRLVSMWIGRDPAFLLVRVAPEVTRVTAV